MAASAKKAEEQQRLRKELTEKAVTFYAQHNVSKTVEKLLNEMFVASPKDVYGYMVSWPTCLLAWSFSACRETLLYACLIEHQLSTQLTCLFKHRTHSFMHTCVLVHDLEHDCGSELFFLYTQSDYFSDLAVAPIICGARCVEGMDERGGRAVNVSIHCTVHGLDKVSCYSKPSPICTVLPNACMH